MAIDASDGALVRHLPCGLYTATRAGVVLRGNPAFARLLGCEGTAPLPALTTAAFFAHPADHDDLWAAAQHRDGLTQHEVAWRAQTGRPLIVRLTGWLLAAGTDAARIEVCVEDVTDARRVEAEMHQAQKLEGVGRLAADVAHDFNNLLTTILGYADLLLTQIDAAKPMYADLFEIQLAGQRAAALTAQLLAFSRPSEPAGATLDLQEVVRTAVPMLRRVLGPGVTLVLTAAPDDVRVQAARGALIQVLMNLATNARDAMPEGGMVTIEIAVVPVPQPPVGTRAARRPGMLYARLSVRDTGTGMDAATQARLFEPFFSTKAWGRGTGLGLPILDGIIRPLGGWMTVTSAPQQGSTFDVYLPTSDAVVDLTMRDARDPADVGRETLLVVDDDPGVLALVSTILTRHGYHVVTADSPAVALALVAAATTPMRAVVTDVMMPGMTGPDLMARLQPLGCTRVVYMSGYAPPEGSREDAEAMAVFLAKPFTARALLTAVRRVMPAPRATDTSRHGSA